MEQQRLLFEAVFKRMPGAPDTAAWLQEVTDTYPYFTAAQFFLLQHTSPGTPAFESQALKTSALFNNPGWLHFQLLKVQAKETNQNQVISETDTVLPPEPKQSVTEDTPDQPLPQPDVSLPESFTGAEPTNSPETADFKQPAVITGDPELSSRETEQKEEMPAAVPEPVPAHIPLPQSPAAEETLLFEPLHTTDYFASVGIKLSEQEKTNDRLGKQLKSFTDWLKTMKRVPGAASTGSTPPASVEASATESHIRRLAEQSNLEGEVLTEAMAGVLLQQGRKDKAIEILEKLSLLNPGKSTYFAAKIHEIKGH